MQESPSTPRWPVEGLATDSSPSKLDSGDTQVFPFWVGPLTLFAAALWLYFPTFAWLASRWHIDEYYAHGPLIPFICAYLIWQKWDVVVRAWSARPRSGITPSSLIFIALLMQIVGSLVDMNTIRALQALSIPIFILGVARYFGGKTFEGELRFPILFFVTAVPVSGPLVEKFTLPLQTYAAASSSMILGLLGMKIQRDGVNLYTPLYHFVVAVPCSGLKIAITLFTLGLLIAHLMPNLTVWQRIGLCLLSLPVALLANTLRVMTIITIGYHYGTKAAEGFLHSGSGLFMFSLSLALLIGAGLYMGKMTAEANSRSAA